MNPQEFRERRKRLKLTQAQLGKVLGVTSRAVVNWEAGDAPISPAVDLATRYLLAGDSQWADNERWRLALAETREALARIEQHLTGAS